MPRSSARARRPLDRLQRSRGRSAPSAACAAPRQNGCAPPRHARSRPLRRPERQPQPQRRHLRRAQHEPVNPSWPSARRAATSSSAPAFTSRRSSPTWATTRRRVTRSAIAKVIMDDYLDGVIDRVYISFAEFVSTANQRPVIRQLLPIEPPRMDEEERRAYRARLHLRAIAGGRARAPAASLHRDADLRGGPPERRELPIGPAWWR
jgi:hypothetical protein